MIDSRLKPLSEVGARREALGARLESHDRVIMVGAGEELRIDIDVAVTPKASFAIMLQEGASLTLVALGEAREDISIVRSIDCVGSNVSVRLLSALRVTGSANIVLDADVRVRADGSNCAIDDRLVIDDSSRSIVRHRMVVDRDVCDSSVSSSVQGMMLGEKAFIRAIPELDVCSNMIRAKHAVVIARPKPESIAYFAARGIDGVRATGLLAEQFLCPIGAV